MKNEAKPGEVKLCTPDSRRDARTPGVSAHRQSRAWGEATYRECIRVGFSYLAEGLRFTARFYIASVFGFGSQSNPVPTIE